VEEEEVNKLIRIAQKACEELEARQVVRVAFQADGRYSVTSYGETKAEMAGCPIRVRFGGARRREAMSEDPILERLDEILDQNIGQLFADLRGPLRALLADAQIEALDRYDQREVTAQEIRARFGVTPSEEPKP